MHGKDALKGLSHSVAQVHVPTEIQILLTVISQLQRPTQSALDTLIHKFAEITETVK